MPTPRPIMVARVGPTVGMLRRWPSSPMRPSAVARPSTAVTMGMPIATRLPKVRTRITMAASRPMTSLLSVGDLDRTLPRLPPDGHADAGPAGRGGGVEQVVGQLLGDLTVGDVQEDGGERG